MQHAGVALATSADSGSTSWSFSPFCGDGWDAGGRVVIFALLRLLLASLAMGAVVWLLAHRVFPYDAAWAFVARAGWIAGAAAAAGAFIAFAALLRAPELGEALGALRRKKPERT